MIFFSSQLHILAIVAADNNEDDNDNIWLKICWKNVVCLS